MQQKNRLLHVANRRFVSVLCGFYSSANLRIATVAKVSSRFVVGDSLVTVHGLETGLSEK